MYILLFVANLWLNATKGVFKGLHKCKSKIFIGIREGSLIRILSCSSLAVKLIILKGVPAYPDQGAGQILEPVSFQAWIFIPFLASSVAVTWLNCHFVKMRLSSDTVKKIMKLPRDCLALVWMKRNAIANSSTKYPPCFIRKAEHLFSA